MFIGKGLQPYDSKDLEAVDKKNTLQVFKDEILPYISEFFNSDGIILDIGCGNGRFTSILKNYFKSVVALDIHRNINPFYLKDNVSFHNMLFQDYNEKVDCLFFMGSFYIQDNYGIEDSFIKATNLLNDNGYIIIIDDKKRNIEGDNSSGFYNLKKMASNNNLKIVKSFIQKNLVHSVNVIKKVNI